jgi:hypothetical protein
MSVKIHVEVFVAAQLLTRSQGTFTAEELRHEIQQRFGDTRPGVNTHISAHCVANAPRHAGTVHNYLWRLDHGLLRAFDPAEDHPHPSRANASWVPNREDVPSEYRYLLPRTAPQPDTEPEPVQFQTPIGSFVCYDASLPFVKYYLFRPDYHQRQEQVDARERAGEQVSWEERRRLRRYGELLLAVDKNGFAADLFLDRELVDDAEVETLIQGVCDVLNTIKLGSDGGAFSVYWMADIAVYNFT